MTLIDRDQLVCIGRVQEAYGLQGEVKVVAMTDDAGYYLDRKTVIVDGGKGLLSLDIETIRLHQNGWIMGFAGMEAREAAHALKGAEVLLEAGDIKPLGAGEYFLDDLIDCDVFGPEGHKLGRVKGLIETGANNVMVVATDSGETLVPMTDEVIKEVDPDNRRIRIEPLPGLFETE